MIEWLGEYGMFLAKAVTIIISIIVVFGSIAALSMRNKKTHEGYVEISSLNESYADTHELMRDTILDEEQLKFEDKEEKKKLKIEAKEKKKEKKKSDISIETVQKPRLYVLDFDGDVKASAVEGMRREISAVLSVATTNDEIVVKVESGGGMVHSYGLAASQLQRIKEKNIPLTVCVDKVAASGGYMMACVADKIIAAPFAILGSIGVVAQLPNFHRLLTKNNIDFEMITAGEHKRTLTMFGENTQKGREKFTEEIEETHKLFKSFVSENRPQVDIDSAATGEIWYGKQALEIQLIDTIATSDSYIIEKISSSDVYSVSYEEKRSLPEKLGLAAESAIERSLYRVITTLLPGRF